MSSGLWPSFLGGLQASLSVLLTLGYGVLAGRIGLIRPSSMKDVSKLCNKMFLPALLIVNVGEQITAGELHKYWPVLGEPIHVTRPTLRFRSISCPQYGPYSTFSYHVS